MGDAAEAVQFSQLELHGFSESTAEVTLYII